MLWKHVFLSVLCLLFSRECYGFMHKHHSDTKERVRFLANGMAIHGTWGMNLDTYFAELVPKKGSSVQYVRVLDEYSA